MVERNLHMHHLHLVATARSSLSSLFCDDVLSNRFLRELVQTFSNPIANHQICHTDGFNVAVPVPPYLPSFSRTNCDGSHACGYPLEKTKSQTTVTNEVECSLNSTFNWAEVTKDGASATSKIVNWLIDQPHRQRVNSSTSELRKAVIGDKLSSPSLSTHLSMAPSLGSSSSVVLSDAISTLMMTSQLASKSIENSQSGLFGCRIDDSFTTGVTSSSTPVIAKHDVMIAASSCANQRRGRHDNGQSPSSSSASATSSSSVDFQCRICTKRYTTVGAARLHARTHTLPCRCPACGKAFSRPWLLRGHWRTHTGERPFQCPDPGCQRAFADRSNLRAHLQTHADVKKYGCGRCPRTFSRVSLLVKHKRTCGT